MLKSILRTIYFIKNKFFSSQILFFFVFSAALSACSSNAPKNIDTNLQTTRLSTNFTDEGIKISYSMFGKLESIEVYGQAEAWRGNVEAVAESDALAKLVKFVYGSNVDTQRRVNIIGKSISAAQDIFNSNKSSPNPIEFSDKELEANESVAKPGSSSNTLRDAKAVNETVSNTITSITAKGRLLGIRKIRDYQNDDGKTYIAVYRWSDKDIAAADTARKRMQRRDD